MKLIVAIVKPFRAQAVLEAIGELAVDTTWVNEAKGYGRQKDQLPRYLGSEYNPVYLPKIEIQVTVSDQQADLVIERLTETARTGRIGDGKILVFPLDMDFEIDF